ncbi:MAG: hypothetical protein H6627_13005 [Calditrichae bacterium]|nr:hypothetical protein [Calditrichota bacterium]MCB9059483.1 hypothetical protein [Calditrichia bacterium]
MKKREFKTKLPLIFAVIIFTTTAVGAFSDGSYWFAVFNLLAAIGNIFALKYAGKNQEFVNIFTAIINAFLAYITAYIYLADGKQYIQYAWFLVGSVYLFTSFLFLKKLQKKYS